MNSASLARAAYVVNDAGFFLSHRSELGSWLLSQGYDVLVLYGIGEDREIRELSRMGFQLRPVPSLGGRGGFLNFLVTIFLLIKAFRQDSVDIVHLVTLKGYLCGGIAARLVRIPAVVSAVSGLGSYLMPESRLALASRIVFFPLLKVAFGHPNQTVILQNGEDLEYLVEWGVLPRSKAVIIPGSGVALDDYQGFSKPLPSPPIVVFAGRLIRDKGILEFIEAVEILKAEGVSAEFVVVGKVDAKNPSALREEVFLNLNARGIVRYEGYCDDMPALLAGASIVCLPSYREGFPKVIMEAAASGRASVVSNVPGCRDAVYHGVSGLVVPVKDSQSLADAIRYLLDNVDVCEKMGQSARRIAEAKFSVLSALDDHRRVYKALLP